MVDAMRFQLSLIFTGGGSNRSQDELRTAREAGHGAVAPTE